jgi:prolyl oligopeptidase
MFERRAIILGLLSGAVAAFLTRAPCVAATPSPPPVAPIQPVTDDYFGTKIVDPYRWMEDTPNPALQGWMQAQNNYTRAILDSISGRAALLARLQAVSKGTDVHGMQIAGGRMFFTLSTNGDTPKLYYRTNDRDHLMFDPQSGVPSGSHGAILYYAPSNDGRFVAVDTAVNGAERETTILVVETSSGRVLGDRISRAWGAVPAWVGNDGFFYSRLPQPQPGAKPNEAEERQQVFFHRLGQDPDVEKPTFGFGTVRNISAVDLSGVFSAPGSRYAIGVVANGVDNVADFYAAPLPAAIRGNADWRFLGKAFNDPLAGSVDLPGAVDVALHGDTLYAIKFDVQRRTEVVRVNLRDGGTLGNAGVVIAPSDHVQRSVTAAADGLYVWSSSAGLSHLERVDYRRGTSRTIGLPLRGTLTEPATDVAKAGVVFGMTTWTQPLQYFAYDPGTTEVAAAGVRSTSAADFSAITTDEVWVTSKDGTRVPLSILHERGISLDGSHPTHLAAYGAYGVALEAQFFAFGIPWLERGGIIAIAHVRGGGEFGEPWHIAGKGAQKQHTIDDFIACAEYLVSAGYTSHAKLAASGGSAGGITIGNAIVQRPDFFAVAVDSHGMTNMLRFEQTANGPPNVPEFGSVKTEPGFKQLYSISAYHHVVDGTAYPAMLLMTGASDPRVDPWMVAEMAARLQAATSSGKPVLFRVDYKSGHGVGDSTAEFNEQLADEWAFELWQMGDPQFQPLLIIRAH